MSDWPAHPALGAHNFNLSFYSENGPGPHMTATAQGGGAWPVANKAFFIPVRLPVPATVFQLICGTGTGTTGNFDVGIYDAGGNRLVSSGSTAKTTASSERIINVTDTVLGPGLYYLAMSTDGVTNYLRQSVATLGLAKLMGVYEMTTAFALPATATFATLVTGYIPALSAVLRPD